MCKAVDEETSSSGRRGRRPIRPGAQEYSSSEENKNAKEEQTPLQLINETSPEWKSPEPEVEVPAPNVYGGQSTPFQIVHEEMSSEPESCSAMIGKTFPENCDSSVDESIDRMPLV